MSTFIPSPFQAAVFENIANGTGHTAVEAVAGSGKTTTIVQGMAHVPAGKKVLFLAFATANVDDLKKKAPQGVEIRSLNSYGMGSVVRHFSGNVRVNKFRVDDMVDALVPGIDKLPELRKDLIDCVGKAKGALASTAEDIDALADKFEYVSATNGGREKFIGYVLTLLAQCKDVYNPKWNHEIDFNDQIWLPIVLRLFQRQFDRVFIDEVQDLNAAQIELVMRAVRKGGRICAVGDRRQAIYGWRGADEQAFQNVVARLDAKLLPLSICYRCCKSVVRVAQEIVPGIEAAEDAPEGEVIDVAYKQMKKDVTPGDFVLSRSNAPLVSLCMALLAEGRPAHIQGRDVAGQLVALVKKSKATTVEALRTYVGEWEKKECTRLAAKRRDTQAVEDKAACIMAISEGAATVADVIAHIEGLFADTSVAGRIVLSSTHRAKGLERDRVWVLQDTYRCRPGEEEDNLWYVAVTRARRTLMLVEGRQ